jgi:ABC-2 type transport system permease protein
MLARIILLARKETWHILRDFRTVYMAFGVPLVLLLLFGYALTMDVDEIPLVVVDQDRSAASRDLTGAFERTGYFVVAERPDSADAILPAFRRNRAKGALVIPPGFGRDLDRGARTKAQMVVDGTDANVAAIAMGYAAAIAQQRAVALSVSTLDRQGLAAARKVEPPITVKSRNWFNPDLKSQWYLVPGLVAIIMAMMSAILMSLTVAREWERGTMEQLLTTPARPFEILLGKIIPYFIIGLGQLTLVAGAGVTLFEVPINGNLGLLYLLSSLFLLGALGQGLLISIITRQQQLATQLALVTSMLPTLLLSGFMSPIASMPQIIQAVTVIVPARYFLVVARGIFLKGSTMAELWPQALALAGFALLMLALGVKRFKTRLDV